MVYALYASLTAFANIQAAAISSESKRPQKEKAQ
jgi:hypothetical protein